MKNAFDSPCHLRVRDLKHYENFRLTPYVFLDDRVFAALRAPKRKHKVNAAHFVLESIRKLITS